MGKNTHSTRNQSKIPVSEQPHNISKATLNDLVLGSGGWSFCLFIFPQKSVECPHRTVTVWQGNFLPSVYIHRDGK